MRSPEPRPRLLLCLSVFALALPVLAQQGAVVFHHFRPYPAGQWTTETQPYRNGQPVGPPVSSTACSAPMSAAREAAIVNLGNAAAPSCTMTTLHDEERTAEYEQVCTLGPNQQITHSIAHAVDDRTITIERRSTLAGQEVANSRSTSHYLGECPAGQAAADKPSPEDCAQLATMRHDTEDALKSCAEQPESTRTTCLARMQAGLRVVQQLERSCSH